MRWQGEFEELMLRIGSRFARVEPRRRVAAFLRGLLAGLPRTNCWTVAEHAGDHDPRAMQRMLSETVWDTDGVRADLVGYVVEHLGDPGAVLVVDETGDVKKGTATVGVQRQYTGTAGRIENSQVAVYLTYAAPAGYALIDRALYLPKSWTSDPDRCAAAGVPAEVGFATKPALATVMIGAALDAGVPASWVAGDEVYGADPKLRAELVRRRIGYVLAVAKDHRITTGIGPCKAVELAVRLPKRAWQRHSAGRGAKGERFYDWALVDTVDAAADPEPACDATGCHWLLLRRNRVTGELAFYRAYSPGPVRLAALVAVAGQRWQIEESFAGAKELTGLDQHQVRTWTSWQRWTLLAMLAHAFLSVQTARAAPPRPRPGRPKTPTAEQPDHLIPLTRNEIRRLLAADQTPPIDLNRCLRWSTWRRRHQATARASHYKRREAALT